MVRAEPLDQSRWSNARWLVLAPHPDDETLGAGALIRQTSLKGDLAAVAYLTDGAGSHPEGTAGLAMARRREARTALHRLSGRSIPIAWIGWRDAHPHAVDDRPFVRDAQRLAALFRLQKIDAVAVTDIAESHCDHAAAFELARAAICLGRRPIALFTYRVWSQDGQESARRIRTNALHPGLRRHALQAHRSQLTSAYGNGFRLPQAQRRMASFDVLTLQDLR